MLKFGPFEKPMPENPAAPPENPESEHELKISEKAMQASAKVTLTLWQKLRNAWDRWVHLNRDAHWFPWFIGFVAYFDAIILFLPGDPLVGLAVLGNPKKWKKTWLISGIASALGAWTMFLLFRMNHSGIIDSLSSALNVDFTATHPCELFQTKNASLIEFTHHWPGFSWLGWVFEVMRDGMAWACNFFGRSILVWLVLGSVLPGLSWPPVVMAGLSGLSEVHPLPVLICLLAGRIMRFFIISYLAVEGLSFAQALRRARDKKQEP